MADVVECEGAPRDLGLDQGRWFRGVLRSRYSELSAWERVALRLGRGPRDERAVHRDLRRHFPQQAEMFDGMARGSDVSAAWLVGRAVAEAEGARSPASLAAGVRGEPGQPGWLARSLPVHPIVRRCQPEGGFRTIELAQPWRASPLAGVNEAGLAVVVRSRTSATADDVCSAPASWLAFDCLQRFEHVAGALDWCEARPAGGRASLLIADGSGDFAVVECEGCARRISRPADGIVVSAQQPEIEECVAKLLSERGRIDAEALGGALGHDVVVIEPGSPRLGLADANGETRWLPVFGGS